MQVRNVAGWWLDSVLNRDELKILSVVGVNGRDS